MSINEGIRTRLLPSPFGDHMYHINLNNLNNSIDLVSNIKEEIKEEVDDATFCINSFSTIKTETSEVEAVTNSPNLPPNAKVTILNSTNVGTRPTIVVRPFQTFNKSGNNITISASTLAGTSSAASGTTTTTTSIPLSSLPLKTKRSLTPTNSPGPLPPLPKKQILMLPKNVGGLGNNRLVRWKVIGHEEQQSNSALTSNSTASTSIGPVPTDSETSAKELWNVNVEAASVGTATTTTAAAGAGAETSTLQLRHRTKVYAAETRTVSLNEAAALSNVNKDHQLTEEEEEEEEESVKKIFTCFHCEFQTGNPWGMRHHDEIHKEYHCELCGERFRSNIAMGMHRKKHLDQALPKVYHCLVQGCNKTFPSAQPMNDHEKSHRETARNHQMMIEMRNRRIEEEQRIEEEITPQPPPVRVTPHNCQVCQTYFDSEFELKMHKRKHDRDLPFTCSHCADKFNTASLLKTHERTHSVFSDPTGTPSQSRQDAPKSDSRWSTAGGEKLWRKDRLKVNRCRMCYMGFHDRETLLNHVCVTQGDTVSVKEILDFQELQYSMD